MSTKGCATCVAMTPLKRKRHAKYLCANCPYLRAMAKPKPVTVVSKVKRVVRRARRKVGL